jgi:hypothetical protein
LRIGFYKKVLSRKHVCQIGARPDGVRIDFQSLAVFDNCLWIIAETDEDTAPTIVGVEVGRVDVKRFLIFAHRIGVSVVI